MQCHEIKESLVTMLYEESMSSDERLQLLDHLQACAPCRHELESFTATRRTLAQWEIAAPPSSFVRVPAPATAGWIDRIQQILEGWISPKARLAYRIIVAVMVLIVCLAFLNAEITWESNKIAFSTSLTRRSKNIEANQSWPVDGGFNRANAVVMNTEVMKDWVEERIMDTQLITIKRVLEITENQDREQGRQTHQQVAALQEKVDRLGQRGIEKGSGDSNRKQGSDIY